MTSVLLPHFPIWPKAPVAQLDRVLPSEGTLGGYGMPEDSVYINKKQCVKLLTVSRDFTKFQVLVGFWWDFLGALLVGEIRPAG